MRHGVHQEYLWIEWENALLSELLRRVPQIVLGRFLVNTSFDSGSIHLSDPERAAGWRSNGTLTFSPRIRDVAAIPSDQFDEWLVFTEPPQLTDWNPFVNYCGFSIANPNDSFQEDLWSALNSHKPQCYLSEGTNLIFITRDKQLHELAIATQL